MSQRRVERKVVEWVDVTPDRQWEPKLECGHEYPCYDGGLSDEAKEAIERDGDKMVCNDCSRAEQRIADLEGELRDLKARRPKN